MNRIGSYGLAAGTFLLDQAVEGVLDAVPRQDRILVPGLADLHIAWNRGISFSFFSQSSEADRWLLSAFMAVLIAGLLTALWRTSRPLLGSGLALIAGGALGNLCDRLFHGAVFDFLFLHLGRLPLFVCNTADIAITLGVLCVSADYWTAPR